MLKVPSVVAWRESGYFVGLDREEPFIPFWTNSEKNPKLDEEKKESKFKDAVEEYGASLHFESVLDFLSRPRPSLPETCFLRSLSVSTQSILGSVG